MKDIQGPFYDLRAYLNSLTPGGGGGGGGSSLVVSSPVGEVGQVNQCRAGRQLALSDFTNLGLSAPRGLWNLSDLTDASGNARALTNKGTVTFSPGVNGAVTTAAQFTGSTSQALYIADTGAADPFRINTGSWGCWFRTAKRATAQYLVAKLTNPFSAATANYDLSVNANNLLAANAYTSTTTLSVFGVSDVADDRWHLVGITFDGTALRVYVDGVLEGATTGLGGIGGVAAPLNIGGYGADSGAAAVSPFYGRVDEAFVTADVLTEDQVRSLYAARLVHTLGAQPKTVSLSVRRQRRGAPLATTDFSTGPLRLHNFTAGSLADQGSNATALTVAAGTPVSGAGADGTLGSGYSFPGGTANLAATDAGLPSGLNSRSYGCWFKGIPSSETLISWGTLSTGDVRLRVPNGILTCNNGSDAVTGPFVLDGQWHFVVMVEDNASGDGVKRKMYLDGRLVSGSTVMNGIALAGANRFRIGAAPDGTLLFAGQIDGAFVTGYAMTTDEVLRLYAKASQTMPSSPKNAGDHVEGYDSGSVLVVCDTLEAQHYVDLTVA